MKELTYEEAIEMHARKDLYKRFGVDTEEADAGLGRLGARTKATWPPPDAFGGVMIDTDYFANVINIGDGNGIAVCTDGVGTKSIIASLMDKYDTIGRDCIAMNVNDMICVGAKPVSMVDYIAVNQANKETLGAIGIGLADGARLVGEWFSISGGETAQLGDVIEGFDLVGMAFGTVRLDDVKHGQDVAAGDIVIGVRSSGIHSNGLTLARNVLLTNSPDENRRRLRRPLSDYGLPMNDHGRTLGDELLEPTDIYVKEALEILKISGVNALVNITSDGLLNLSRVSKNISFEIDNLIEPHPIFDLIQRRGSVDDHEMFQIFNMGIGFCYVVSPDSADQVISVLRGHGRQAQRIGRAVPGENKTVRILERNLIGEGKKFWKNDDFAGRVA